MDYRALLMEIETGPLAAECVGKTDAEIAAILNDPRFTRRVMVPIADIQAYIYTQGSIWWDVQMAAADTLHPGYQAARAVVDLMGARFQNLDFTLLRVQEVLTGLELAGLLTAAQRADIEAMSYVSVSRGEIVGLGTVLPDDIAWIRR